MHGVFTYIFLMSCVYVLSKILYVQHVKLMDDYLIKSKECEENQYIQMQGRPIVGLAYIRGLLFDKKMK